MDELEIKGGKYISSKRAAELTGYAKDYIGQLARQNKVLATRVGRAWYVSLSDIKKHAGITEESEEEFQKEEVEAPILKSEVQTQTVPKREEVRTYSIHHLQSQSKKRDILKTWSEVKYDHDDRDLLPNFTEKKELQAVHIVPIKKADIVSNNIVIPANDPVNVVTKKGSLTPSLEKQKDNIKSLDSISFATKLNVIGSAVTLAALLIAFVGANIPSETTLSLGSQQLASGSAIDTISGPLQDYFLAIFNEGLILLGGFLLTLKLSFETFIAIGINFFINLF